MLQRRSSIFLSLSIITAFLFQGTPINGYEKSSGIGHIQQSPVCDLVDPPVQVEPVDGRVFLTIRDYTNEDRLTFIGLEGLEYQLQVFDPGNPVPLLDQIIPSYGMSVPFMGGEGPYQWRLRTLHPKEGCPPSAWTSLWTYTIQRLYTYPITSLHATQGTYLDHIVLTWVVDDRQREFFYPPDWYYIYRTDGSSAMMTAYDWVRDLDARTYIDTNVEPGKKYTYWVQSYHDKLWTQSSDKAEGWTASANVLNYLLFLPAVSR